VSEGTKRPIAYDFARQRVPLFQNRHPKP